MSFPSILRADDFHAGEFSECGMASNFLSRDELAELIGCQPTSRACMRRWLEKQGWPFVPDRNGLPKVRRDYYDARMTGCAQPSEPTTATEPNRSVFRELHK